MAESPKSESEQEDSLWTAQFKEDGQERFGFAGYLVPAPDKETALRLAHINAGNEGRNPPEIKKSSVHKAHAYDIINSDIVRNSFEDTMYVAIETVDNEVPMEDLKNY